MLIQHRHTPEEFDPGHCRTCAGQAGLLDHDDLPAPLGSPSRQKLRQVGSGMSCYDLSG